MQYHTQIQDLEDHLDGEDDGEDVVKVSQDVVPVTLLLNRVLGSEGEGTGWLKCNPSFWSRSSMRKHLRAMMTMMTVSNMGKVTILCTATLAGLVEDRKNMLE